MNLRCSEAVAVRHGLRAASEIERIGLYVECIPAAKSEDSPRLKGKHGRGLEGR
ncbi:MAG: hypothetical protein ACLQM8_05775 [Limisphaerales bacterium]